ncbi:MAG: hypothetical protein CMJ19_00480 [Phycisphaeraceae bacterium]|nr:hypothetical protein [Phycisphaeraceae bacterium]
MKYIADYIVVGTGLTGSVIARLLKDAGKDVLMLEKREHVGGNVHDQKHESGVLMHTYGPHYFRTHSNRIWEFVNRFSNFYSFKAIIKAKVTSGLENWPIAANYIQKHVGEHWEPEFTGTPLNFEQAALSLMPRKVYELFIKEYNEKQWGVKATELSADLCKRFNVRADNNPYLTPGHAFQGLPLQGYHQLMLNMIHGIPYQLDVDFLKNRDKVQARKLLIYTGPIDAFFDYEFGRLAYRGQRRETVFHENQKLAQPCVQVNTPMHIDGSQIRRIEWKHLQNPSSPNTTKGTLITTETPFSPDNPDQFEYPFPDSPNQTLFRRYHMAYKKLNNIMICGRLGEYRYYDMDQVIARAIYLAEKLL